MKLEHAGVSSLGDHRPVREGVMARAPAWWRALAARGVRPAAVAQRRPADDDETEGGWIVGVVAPGESSPAYCAQDRQTLPEKFSPAAWDAVLEQVREGSKPIGLWVQHNGMMLACTSARTLRLERHPVLGMMFQATLAATSFDRMLLEEIGRGGVACSVAFRSPALSYEQRGGSKVRVIQRCVVEHVALVRKGRGERALYPAARCFAVTADKRDQLAKAWSDARTESWKAMRGRHG